MQIQPTSRREFLKQTSAAGAGFVLGTQAAGAADQKSKAARPFPKGKAEHCIMIWLGGGSCHIDTWDPKRVGDPQTKKPGSAYAAIETAIPGTQICEHLPKCAALLDRFNLVRSMHHDVIDEHAAATNRVHTGRPTSGTIVYPSIGSIVAEVRGPVNEDAPAYVLMGYPNVTRGPGYLGAKAGYIYLTDTHLGPAGFTRSADVNDKRQDRRERLLAQVRAEYLQRAHGGKTVQDYDASVNEALRLSGPQFMQVFQLNKEPSDLRQSYGGEFGQRCLLARRLLQSGVRFIEVSHNMNFVNGTGWDTHNDGQKNQHLLIRELDAALSTLVTDLEHHKMLDETLIVVAGEFGRPANWDAGGGRGHHPKAFSVALAGGGLRNGKTIGVTDDLGMEIVEAPVSIPNLHATICCTLGIDPSEYLYDAERPVPITDNGKPIRELF